jgi:hypothetical protein
VLIQTLEKLKTLDTQPGDVLREWRLGADQGGDSRPPGSEIPFASSFARRVDSPIPAKSVFQKLEKIVLHCGRAFSGLNAGFVSAVLRDLSPRHSSGLKSLRLPILASDSHLNDLGFALLDHAPVLEQLRIA